MESPADEQTYPSDVQQLYRDHFDFRGTGYHCGVAVNDAITEESDVTGFGGTGLFVFQTGWAKGSGEGEKFPPGVQGSVFMHELDHSVGLASSDYRGIDSTSMPYTGYPSVMNYNAPNDEIGYSSGEGFDDWEYIETGLNSPNTGHARPG